MGFIKEFKEFTLKGNVVELAVAVIIGAAFGAIVTSLVDDVITPLLLTPVLSKLGLDDISQLKWGAVSYGKFLSAVIKFLFISFVLFWIVKSAKKIHISTPPAPTATETLLTEIRDELKKR